MEMAIDRPLSKHSREQLARNIDEVWFRELLENLRYASTFANRIYTANRTISEFEHQAMNGSFREGAAHITDRIALLAKEPEEVKPQLVPFGTLVPPTPDPKAVYTPKK